MKNNKLDYISKQDTGINRFSYRKEFRNFNRRNNDLYAACYALYLTGKSIRYIAKVHYKGRFTHQVLYEAFVARGYKLRSKRLRPAKIYKGIEYRPDGYGHYRNRNNGVTVYLHKLIWEEVNGPIPPNHYIIIKDGNKENIVIENLKCISSMEAKKQYNHANQFGYKRFQGRGIFGI